MEKKHDIFFCYSSTDRTRVQPIIEKLEQLGFTVWWDVNIPPGVDWENFLEENLDASRTLVVAWSGAAIESTFVRAEAASGRDTGSLIQIFLEEVKAPLYYRGLQGAKLIDWKGEENQEWEKFIRAIQTKLGKGRSTVKRKTKQSQKAWLEACQINTPEAYYHFLDKNWNSPHAKEALQKIKALGKQKPQATNIPATGQKRPLLTPPPGLGKGAIPAYGQAGTQGQLYNYWTKRLQTIQYPPVSGSTRISDTTTPAAADIDTDFVFYKSPAFYIALILLPALGLLGAWLTDLGLAWLSQQFSFGEFYVAMPKVWLYLAGFIWGLVYLIRGTIEASDTDDWEELYHSLWVPFEALFEDGHLGGLVTALPLNLILSWTITFVFLFFTFGVQGTGTAITMGVLSLIQILIYSGMDEY